MKKRISTVLLAFIMTFICIIPSFALTENQKAQVLVKKGWIRGRGNSTQNLDLDKKLTRAEVARIVCAVTNSDAKADSLKNQQSIFKDVKKNHWANGYINLAVKKGYISGYPDNSFKPENYISYEELFTLLVRLDPNWTSYRSDIPYGNDSWSSKYLNVAKFKGLMDDVPFDYFPDFSTRGNTFAIIYNMNRYNYANINENGAEEVFHDPMFDSLTGNFENTDNVDNTINTNNTTVKNTTTVTKTTTENSYKKKSTKPNVNLEDYTIKTLRGNETIRGKILDNEDELLRLVNIERKKEGSSPLKKGDSFLSNLADQRAPEVAYSFSHTRPGGGSPIDDVLRGGSYTAGENIAYGQNSPEEVIDTWMNSWGHKANILNPNFKSVSQRGFVDSKGTIYWVQVFGTKTEDDNSRQNSNYNKYNYNKWTNYENDKKEDSYKEEKTPSYNYDNESKKDKTPSYNYENENTNNQTPSYNNENESTNNQTPSYNNENESTNNQTPSYNNESKENQEQNKEDVNSKEQNTKENTDKNTADDQNNTSNQDQDKNKNEGSGRKLTDRETTLYVYMQKSVFDNPQDPLYTFIGVTVNFKPKLSGFLNPKYVDVNQFSNWELLSGDAQILYPSSYENAVLKINSTSEPVSIRANFN